MSPHCARPAFIFLLCLVDLHPTILTNFKTTAAATITTTLSQPQSLYCILQFSSNMQLYYCFFFSLLLPVNGNDATNNAILKKHHLRRSSRHNQNKNVAGRNLSSINNHHTCPPVVGSCPYHTSKILKCVNASSNKDCTYLGHCAAKKAGFTVDTDCEVISPSNGGDGRTGPTTSPSEVPTVAPTMAPTISPTGAPVTTCLENCEADAEEDKEECLEDGTCMTYFFGMCTLEDCCEATKVQYVNMHCHLTCGV